MKQLTFILLLVMTCSLAKAQKDDRGYIVKVGEKAPDIELLFPDGTKKHLKDLKGKVIMLQFTASCCRFNRHYSFTSKSSRSIMRPGS